jgi:hypothetical protein
VPKKLTELIKTPQNDCWFMINELKIGVWVCYNRVSVRYNQENTMLSSPKPTKYNFLFALEFAITKFVINEFDCS